MRDAGPLARLEADGFVRTDGSGAHTTPRWQAAMARAALDLHRSDAPWRDLRLPIAAALIRLYRDAGDDEIASYVEALLPIEEAPLDAAGAEKGAGAGT
jgi:hypothetical protein